MSLPALLCRSECYCWLSSAAATVIAGSPLPQRMLLPALFCRSFVYLLSFAIRSVLSFGFSRLVPFDLFYRLGSLVWYRSICSIVRVLSSGSVRSVLSFGFSHLVPFDPFYRSGSLIWFRSIWYIVRVLLFDSVRFGISFGFSCLYVC